MDMDVKFYIHGNLPHTRRGDFEVEKRPVQDMPGHVGRSIYSMWLSRRQHRHGADADWGV